MTDIKKFPRYQANLHYTCTPAWNLPSNRGPMTYKVFSYGTCVAVQQGSSLIEMGWWSVTTSKHVRYAAEQLGLNYVKHSKNG
jgi:hypothetical protein